MAFTAVFLFSLCAVALAGIPWEAAPRTEEWWLPRHQGLLNQTKAHLADIKVVFFGDSITEGWAGNGKAVWNEHYAPRGAYNYGIGGDRTEHLIWRVNNGEFDGVKAKFVVLKIGTNNIGSNTPADIAKGVHAVIDALKVKMPDAKVLLLSVLPRQPETTDTLVHEINKNIATFDDKGAHINYLDLTTHFETALGKEVEGFFYDTVHLTAKGYEEWYKTMEPLFAKMLM